MEPDEKDLLQSFEDEEWQPVPNSAELIAKLKQAAKKCPIRIFA
jgi:ferredoxin